ncbi:uncharacterized protein VTP21DRAFT_11228 [Calcarisporiella thermophila]|uniref:uncharacterized protein n=1 Tax=Calcarisporiella thermophila TaxID=911321 RepID=UPI0037423E70
MYTRVLTRTQGLPLRRTFATTAQRASARTLQNYINNQFVPSSASSVLPVTSPHDGKVIANVPLSPASEADSAVAAAKKAFPEWSSLTVKDRVQYLYKLHRALTDNMDELAKLIQMEHGKNYTEAIGSISKGMETLEYAISLPQLIQGKILDVSRGVSCFDRREPLGVVAGIVPFNFPIMIPLWLLPFSIACGNTFVLKPSEKVPLTMNRVYEMIKDIGLPEGVVNLVNGDSNVVNALIDNKDVKAVAFVGSSRVAEIVAQRSQQNGKRVLALGGAKNHLVAAPDCNVEMTAQDVVNSFSGCSGQRCMAASALLIVGKQQALLDQIVKRASTLKVSREDGCVGPVIDEAAQNKILGYINDAEKAGAQILLDGRQHAQGKEGWWVGPTIILHKNKSDAALREEIFGPVLSVYECSTPEEAIEIENSNPYGNAACIYTTTGATADWFTRRFSTGMVGVNIGTPVPREPFSFGGINKSRFGSHVDMTGDGGIEFFTWRRKITTKWTKPAEQHWLN